MPAPKVEHRTYTRDAEPVENHTWSMTIDGFHVAASRDGDDGVLRLSIAPEAFDRARLGIVQMHPRRLSELEELAAAAPTLLPKVAAALREALGTDDVRSRWDQMLDQQEESMRALRLQWGKEDER